MGLIIDPCDQEFEADRDAGKMDISMGKAHDWQSFTPDVLMCCERLAMMLSGRANLRLAIASFLFLSLMSYTCETRAVQNVIQCNETAMPCVTMPCKMPSNSVQKVTTLTFRCSTNSVIADVPF